MVLEHVFPEDWLERKARYSFILGFGYSIIGIGLAKVLFPDDAALAAVAFTSLLLLPELDEIFNIEEREEGKEKQFSFTELWRDNLPFVRIYVLLFLGMAAAYAVAAMYLPTMEVNELFRQQLELRMGNAVQGEAIAHNPLFGSLLGNNFLVLLACFFVALLTGDGAVFLISWNASVWGTLFGVTARRAGDLTAASPSWYLLVIVAITLPHVLLEALSYILAAVSGSVISKDVLLERFDSQRFNLVFLYNFVLFIIALVFLVVGAGVETYVLEHSERYAEIIAASYV